MVGGPGTAVHRTDQLAVLSEISLTAASCGQICWPLPLSRASIVASHSEDLSLWRGEGWRIYSIWSPSLYLGNFSSWEYWLKVTSLDPEAESLAPKAQAHDLALANPEGSAKRKPSRLRAKVTTSSAQRQQRLRWQSWWQVSGTYWCGQSEPAWPSVQWSGPPHIELMGSQDLSYESDCLVSIHPCPFPNFEQFKKLPSIFSVRYVSA